MSLTRLNIKRQINNNKQDVIDTFQYRTIYMIKRFLILFVMIFMFSDLVFSQSKIRVWEGVESMKKAKKEILIYPASQDNNNGAAVIICPGGSYHHLGVPHEGIKSAEWFNEQGVSAFVLCYRTAYNGEHHPAMIQDFQRCMQFVKENADKYGIDTTRVGAIGYSAGGHLVTMAGAIGKENFLKELGVETKVGLRPSWVASIYPVVSMQDSIAHRKSRKNLIGSKEMTQENFDKFSMEMQIPDDMPPIYVQASIDDDVVDYRNSVALVKALKDKNINHKFVLFETGGHGYGMKECDFTTESRWQDILLQWLKDIDVIR